MIKITEHTNGSITLEMDTPERVVIAEIAVGFVIPKEDALAAVIYRGMDSIVCQLKTAAGKRLIRREIESRHTGGD